MEIRFGTDGWRGIVGRDVTPERIAAVADAVARYLSRTGTEGRGMIIGHDCRGSSREFALAAADAVRSRGVDVWLSSGHAPTPSLAFAVGDHRAAGALVITASHNPAQYNGIKFIPHYCGPATDDISREIEQLIAKPSGRVTTGRGILRQFDPRDGYLAHVCGLAGDGQAVVGCRVVVDPLYGAGRGYVDQALAHLGCDVRSIHCQHDPEFGGRAPDPSPENLDDLKREVTRQGAELGLALDGDGDRLAAVAPDGRVLTANRLLPLIYRHLVRDRGLSGGIARTVATTHTLDRLARKYMEPVVETPVGFKHVGPLICRGDILLAGEESGGISMRGHVPDKDAILGAVLAVAMVARAEGDLGDCWDDLTAVTGPAVFTRVDIPLSPDIEDRVRRLLTDAAVERDDGVSSVKRIDGLKVEYVDGSWWLARPSGTEPLMRLYGEADTEDRLLATLDRARRILTIDEEYVIH